jgi:hypothetical protein
MACRDNPNEHCDRQTDGKSAHGRVLAALRDLETFQ